MISAMTRFEIVGPKDELWEVLDVLQDVGACHLEPTELEVPGSDRKLTRPELDEADASFRHSCEELAGRYETAMAALPPQIFRQSEAIASHELSLSTRGNDALLKLARSRLASWQLLHERIDNLAENQVLLQRYLQILDALAKLHVHSSSVVIPLLLDDASMWDRILTEAGELCTKSAHQLEHHYEKLRGGAYLLALAVPADAEEAVREYVWEQKIPEVVFPREYADLKPMQVRDKLEARLGDLPDEIAEARAELEFFVDNSGPELVALGNRVIDEAARFGASQTAALSEYAFRLHGWIPKDQLEQVRHSLSGIGTGAVEFQTLPVDPHHDTPPTRLSNPGLFRPAETLLRIFPPQGQGGVDPSPLMLFTFPLFFGWMVGDAGYGALLLLLVLWAWNKWGAKNKLVGDICYVFTFASLSAIFFGVMFGEYFGHVGVWLLKGDWHGHIYVWMGRTPEYLPRYLGLSLLLGLVHMTVSLLFGIYTAAQHKAHGDEHADQHILEKSGMLLSLYGFLLITISGMVPPLTHLGLAITENLGLLTKAGWGMVLLGIALLAYALPGLQRVTAPIEGVAIVSNTISYARLMAVGAAGVVLADMANRIGRLGEGKAMWLAALFVALSVLAHLAAFVLIIFDPLIQGLRLHYVEFFSKFYEPTGVAYTPFARKGGSY